ncbi:hypothetical protein ACT691_07010 [Vibrio metschnikovii]
MDLAGFSRSIPTCINIMANTGIDSFNGRSIAPQQKYFTIAVKVVLNDQPSERIVYDQTISEKQGEGNK